MILADTNVISEPLKPRPLKRVVEWLSRQDEYDMYVASVCQAELLFGIALLSPGRRRQAMEAGWDRMLDDVFQGRILPFDPLLRSSSRSSFRARGRPVTRSRFRTGRSRRLRQCEERA